MSRKYKLNGDTVNPFFVTFTLSDWIDLLIRTDYTDILLESIKYCQSKKELFVYAWCKMINPVHLIIGTQGRDLSDNMPDLKRRTSEQLHQCIITNRKESRREWMLELMKRAGRRKGNNFQLWQA